MLTVLLPYTYYRENNEKSIVIHSISYAKVLFNDYKIDKTMSWAKFNNIKEFIATLLKCKPTMS